jgi:hypothetical protein
VVGGLLKLLLDEHFFLYPAAGRYVWEGRTQKREREREVSMVSEV